MSWCQTQYDSMQSEIIYLWTTPMSWQNIRASQNCRNSSGTYSWGTPPPVTVLLQALMSVSMSPCAQYSITMKKSVVVSKNCFSLHCGSTHVICAVYVNVRIWHILQLMSSSQNIIYFSDVCATTTYLQVLFGRFNIWLRSHNRLRRSRRLRSCVWHRQPSYRKLRKWVLWEMCGAIYTNYLQRVSQFMYSRCASFSFTLNISRLCFKHFANKI